MKIMTLILALGLAVGGFVAPTAPVGPDDGAVTMVAAPAFAGVLRPGQALLVSGTVTNNTGQSLDVGTASVHLFAARMVTRNAVSRWLTGDGPSTESRTGDAVGEVSVGTLALGQSRSFSITVPETSLAFMNGVTGVFPLEIRLTADRVNVASQHSVVSWLPDGQVPRIRLSVATPLNAPPSSVGLLDAETLEVLTSPGGSLYEQLTTALRHTVAIGVDPRIVASIRLLSGAAPQSARDWLQQLEAAPNDVFSLSYADADQLLLHRAGATAPVDPISFPEPNDTPPPPVETEVPNGSDTAPASTVPGTVLDPDSPMAMRTTIDGLAWPSRSPASAEDLDFLTAGGSTRLLLSSSEVEGSAVFTPNVTVGEHDVTVSDDSVSSLLRAASGAESDVEWACAIASLTATLAVTAAQSSGATVVATLGRDLVSPSRMVGSTLRTVETLPWVDPLPLRSAINLSPVKGSLADSAEDASVDSGDGDRTPLTKRLLESEVSLSQFASVVDDPTLVTGPQRLQLLALASAAWAGDFSAWSAAARAHLIDNSEMLESVHLPDSSSVNLIQEKFNLPVTVRNELDFPVTVFVTVRAERAILNVTDKRVQLVIEANSQAKAFVPVESIANGEVRTTVSLSSPTGVPISQPTIVTLNVQAGWETTATVVLAVIIIALFGAGIWRTVLRRRSMRKQSDVGEQEAL